MSKGKQPKSIGRSSIPAQEAMLDLELAPLVHTPMVAEEVVATVVAAVVVTVEVEDIVEKVVVDQKPTLPIQTQILKVELRQV